MLIKIIFAPTDETTKSNITNVMQDVVATIKQDIQAS